MRKSKNLFCLTLIIILFFTFRLFAQGDAGQAGEFLRYGVGSRALALGGAFGAIANDATASYWNPAGISQIKNYQFSLMYNKLLFGDRLLYGGLITPIKTDSEFDLSMGINIVNLMTDGYQERDEFNEYYGNFNDVQNAFLFNIAVEYDINNWLLCAGINYNYITQKVNNLSNFNNYNYESSDHGFDLGIIVKLPSGFLPVRFGFTHQNLYQPKLKLASSIQKYPENIRFSLAIDKRIRENLNFLSQFKYLDILPIIELVTINDVFRDKCFNFGFESKILNDGDTKNFNLRLGIRDMFNLKSFTFGIGIKWLSHFSIDYYFAYWREDFLTSFNCQNFTINFYWNKSDKNSKGNNKNEFIQEL